MNIHFAMIEGSPHRLNAAEAKARKLTIGDRSGTRTPITRTGQTYPGGKVRRKAMAKLTRRVAVFEAMKDNTGFTRPGSMRA